MPDAQPKPATPASEYPPGTTPEQQVAFERVCDLLKQAQEICDDLPQVKLPDGTMLPPVSLTASAALDNGEWERRATVLAARKDQAERAAAGLVIHCRLDPMRVLLGASLRAKKEG